MSEDVFSALENRFVEWLREYRQKETPEEVYHRALWELERARANFNEALAAYAREYADGEALTAQAIEREGED